MSWYLTGEKGTIQFVIYTNWQLPHVQAEHDAKHDDHFLCKPLPADIGYHSPVPQYEGQTKMDGPCEFVDGDCYYDGSSLSAEKGYGILVAEGGDAVWDWMEGWYKETFEEKT